MIGLEILVTRTTAPQHVTTMEIRIWFGVDTDQDDIALAVMFYAIDDNQATSSGFNTSPRCDR